LKDEIVTAADTRAESSNKIAANIKNVASCFTACRHKTFMP
jgi:hypothetical protein